MDEAQNQTASSLSDRVCNYDVFISFRGEDTRKTFVSHLDKSLFDRGIVTFKDDRKIKTGEFIHDELCGAIRTSRFAIVVISENYAASRWCLDELQLILEEKIEVVPIFYEVKPSDLKHHRGSFSLDMYQGTEPVEKVAGWKRALRVIADVKGKESTKCMDDAAMIEEIVQSLSSRLLSMLPIDFDDVVGMKAHMKAINPLLDMDSKDEARIIGISGTGGIGKTTIAKFLYEQLKSGFSPRHHFMENVAKISGEHGLLHLQHQLLSNIFREENLKLESIEQGRQQLAFRFRHVKVLLVLDDVDDMQQLFALAKDVRWFGPGSRIIITTRNKSLLNSCRVYDVKYLDDDKAIQLFHGIAFEGGRPPSREYRNLSNRVSRLAQGLPLALKAFGFFLQRKSILEWENALESLENASYNNMMRILNISYNRLDEVTKCAFHHVACIFNGEPVKRVMTLVDRGEVGIKVLAEKSLIDISADGRIGMNHLLRQLGKQVVHQESGDNPAQQQILWNHYYIYRVLADNAGTDITEGVSLDVSNTPHDFNIEWKLFKPMENLNFLKIYNNIKCQTSFDSKTHLNLKGNSLPPCKLRLLHWDAYPFTTLPSIVHFDCLVELNLSYSKLITLWNGTLRLSHLKKLNLTGSKYLKELPDLQEAVYLEELMLRGCVSLTRIPKSICSLSKLQKLDLLWCDGLKNLRTIVRESEATTVFQGRSLHVRSAYVDFLGAEPLVNESQPQGLSLTDLSITGSLEIELKILEGQAEILCFITEQQTPHQLADGLLSLPYGFKSLDIGRFNCNKESNPFKCYSFLGLVWLKELNLINLNIKEIPDDIHHMQVLEKLDLSGNDMMCLPTSMMLLSKLKHVTLCNCRMLVALPELYQLETLTLSDCTELRALVNLPQTYQGRSYSLLELTLDNCKNVVSLSDELSHFKKLRYLDISRHDFETMPPSIKNLSSLVTLCLNYCNKLKSLTKLPLSLKYLYAHGCMSLESNFLSAGRFYHLDISPCLQRNMDCGRIIRFPSGKRSEEVPICFCAQKSKMMSVGNQGRSSHRPDLKQRSKSKNLRLVTFTIFTGVFVCFRRWATATKSL